MKFYKRAILRRGECVFQLELHGSVSSELSIRISFADVRARRKPHIEEVDCSREGHREFGISHACDIRLAQTFSRNIDCSRVPLPIQPLGPTLNGQNADCAVFTDSVVTVGSEPAVQRSGL